MTGHIRHTYSRMRIVHYNGQRFEVWEGLGGARTRSGKPKAWTCSIEWIITFNGTHRTSLRKCG